MSKQVKKLKMFDQVFVLENKGDHWTYKKARILRIEKDSPTGAIKRIFCTDSPYLALKFEHVFDAKDDAEAAAKKLTILAKEASGTKG